MTRDEKIVAAIAKQLTAELKKEITMLRAKLRSMEAQRDKWKASDFQHKQDIVELRKQVSAANARTRAAAEQRDDWKYSALKYQKQLINERSHSAKT